MLQFYFDIVAVVERTVTSITKTLFPIQYFSFVQEKYS